MLFGTLAFGGFLWLWNVWAFWDFNRSVSWILFLLVVSMLGGVLWSWVMWHFFGFRSRLRQSTGSGTSSGSTRGDV